MSRISISFRVLHGSKYTLLLLVTLTVVASDKESNISASQLRELSGVLTYDESVEIGRANNFRERYNDFKPLPTDTEIATTNATFPPLPEEIADDSKLTTPRAEVVSQNISTILNTLLQNYDKRLRPNYGGPPVVVSVTIYVSTISAISEVEMDYTIDMYVRQYWYDARLAFTGINESLTIGIDMVKNIWVPDTFFPNEKKSFFHDSTTHNGFLRIAPDGQMLRSIRLTVTANCPMNLKYFPMDRQNCSLEIESYGYSTRDITYTWKGGSSAVDIAPDINLAQFSVTGHANYERVISLSTGNYSRLSAHFTFRRNLGFYLIQIYLPSSLIVVISWVSFWLNREATQARVTIGVTTVLTMTTLMTSTNAAMPKVSYVKSIDIYLGTCFVIVFASLLEYAAVGYLLKRVKMEREKAEQRLSAIKALPAMMFGNATAAAAAAVGGAVSGPPLPFMASHGAALSPNHVQSPLATADSCGHEQCRYMYQHQPSYDRNVSVGLLLSGKPQGYQSMGQTQYEMQAYPAGKPCTEPSSPPNLEAALACDCEMEMTALRMSDDPPPGVSREFGNGRRVRRRRGRGGVPPERMYRPSSIDKYSRIFFPLSFVCFHVIYWIVYLYAAEDTSNDSKE